jgi:hypothetical protein
MGRATALCVLLTTGCAERALPLPNEETAPDLAAATDGATDSSTEAAPDLAVPDLAVAETPDFAIFAPPDLAALRDLAVPLLVDLAAAPDLRPAVDAAGLEVRFGIVPPLPDTSTHLLNFLVGHPIAVTQPVTLVRFGLNTRPPPACQHGMWGLYSSDAAGNPDQLLSSTASTSLSPGVNEIPTPPVALAPGTYWMMGVYEVNCQISVRFTTTNPTKYISFTYGTPLPARWPAVHTTYDGFPTNYWLVGLAQ